MLNRLHKIAITETDYGLLILLSAVAFREMDGVVIAGAVLLKSFIFQNTAHIAFFMVFQVFGDVRAVHDE